MNIYDYIILGVIAVCILAAVIYIIKRRRRGDYFCSGSCDGCKSCKSCAKNGKEVKK